MKYISYFEHLFQKLQNIWLILFLLIIYRRDKIQDILGYRKYIIKIGFTWFFFPFDSVATGNF
jgi:hypothetical protein